jgi:hypothetical protein
MNNANGITKQTNYNHTRATTSIKYCVICDTHESECAERFVYSDSIPQKEREYLAAHLKFTIDIELSVEQYRNNIIRGVWPTLGLQYWYVQQMSACIKNKSKYFDQNFFKIYPNVITFKNYDNPLYFKGYDAANVTPGNEKNKKLFMNVELMIILMEYLNPKDFEDFEKIAKYQLFFNKQGYDYIFSELELDEFYSKIDNSKIKKGLIKETPVKEEVITLTNPDAIPKKSQPNNLIKNAEQNQSSNLFKTFIFMVLGVSFLIYAYMVHQLM